MGREDPATIDQKPLPAALSRPQISLLGEVDKSWVEGFRDQLDAAEQKDGDIVVEVTTLGGDAELARRIVLEIDLARKRLGRRFLFLGKTVVYSAGMTVMSAFPRADRFLTEDAVLLIHCRQLDKKIEISGPMRASRHEVEAVRAQMENGIAIEEGNFRRLIEGSDIDFDALLKKALRNWYLRADEALRHGLVAGLMGTGGPAEGLPQNQQG